MKLAWWAWRLVMGVEELSRVTETDSEIYGITCPLFFLQGREADRNHGSLSSPNSPRLWESSWPLWEIIPSRRLDRVTENKISGLVSSTKCHAGEGGAITELYDCMGQSHLSNIRVGIFRVNAPVLLHILEGIGHVAPSTAIILRHTVHQVLWTQI